jgi:hypothetical protein
VVGSFSPCATKRRHGLLFPRADRRRRSSPPPPHGLINRTPAAYQLPTAISGSARPELDSPARVGQSSIPRLPPGRKSILYLSLGRSTIRRLPPVWNSICHLPLGRSSICRLPPCWSSIRRWMWWMGGESSRWEPRDT